MYSVSKSLKSLLIFYIYIFLLCQNCDFTSALSKNKSSITNSDNNGGGAGNKDLVNSATPTPGGTSSKYSSGGNNVRKQSKDKSKGGKKIKSKGRVSGLHGEDDVNKSTIKTTTIPPTPFSGIKLNLDLVGDSTSTTGATSTIDPGIMQSNWIGINNFPLERKNMDALSLDFSNLQQSTIKQPQVQILGLSTPPSANPSHATMVDDDFHFNRKDGSDSILSSLSINKMEIAISKILELEKMMTTINRNIEVMQQNTQVISKGFNILSGRVNSVTAENQNMYSQIGKNFRSIETSFLKLQNNFTKELSNVENKRMEEMEHLKKSDKELIETQVINSQDSKKWMNNFSQEMNSWKMEMNGESQVIAEMVKALAEIQKKEKSKLESISNETEIEFKKLGEKITTLQVNMTSSHETLSMELRNTKEGLETSNQMCAQGLLTTNTSIDSLSNHVKDQLKRLEENVLEQNMAHNMAHENIASKLNELQQYKTNVMNRGKFWSDLSSSGENSDPKNSFKQILTEIRNNATIFQKRNQKLFDHLQALEQTDVSTLNKIAEIRNVQKNLNATIAKDLNALSKQQQVLQEEIKGLEIKLKDFETRKALKANTGFEIGGLSMSTSSMRNSDNGQQPQNPMELLEADEIKDRVVTLEENIGELWRDLKDFKGQHANFQTLINDFQQNYEKDSKDSSHQLMEIKIATKLLTEIVRNSTKDIVDMDKKFEKISNIENNENLSRSKSHSFSIGENNEWLQTEMKTVQENIANLWDSNKNVSKAQEFFLLKMLEMDLEHRKGNSSLWDEITRLKSTNDIFQSEFNISEERISKVVQQFEINDAEQMKIREELLNIKDRLAGAEENYANTWKTNKKLSTEMEDVVNSLDNLIVIHGSELKNISTDLSHNKDKLENITNRYSIISSRLTNLELLLDIVDASAESNSTEFSKIKTRLSNSEKDINELWRSTEILSFQQQVINDNYKTLLVDHQNQTELVKRESEISKEKTSAVQDTLRNLTERLSTAEKCINPNYETKSLDLTIADWHSSIAGGLLKDRGLTYTVGDILGAPSTFRVFLELTGNHISIFHTLINASRPIFNELQADVLDVDGRPFTSLGPDLHLYKQNNDKNGWVNAISLQTLEAPKNKLLAKNSLRIRFRMKVFPKIEKDEEGEIAPTEKQLIQWEVHDVLKKLHQSRDKGLNDGFLDLNVTKEFGTGRKWGYGTMWKLSLLKRAVNNQKYFGLNVELLDNADKWKQLTASYNVTLFDAQSRAVKEFSIPSNDFKTVAARHSYFMFVKDIEEVLKHGDALTFKINFDLHAQLKSFDVEVIK